ncbi:MAG: glycine cleavage system protein GcvH [Gordonibacter sp.]|uniref:glycine cleavage system protein GcvH n=1 Tax=Gordonibacter sp. TaxID=1968902 RepID=UPI002FC6E1E0
MSVPAELKYTDTHEWVSLTEDMATIGLTDYAQDQLGDLVFVNLPEPGDEASAGEAVADVESVKAVSDVVSPLSGTVEEVNEELLDNPALINEDPYGTWLMRLSVTAEPEGLMDAAAYEALCATL